MTLLLVNLLHICNWGTGSRIQLLNSFCKCIFIMTFIINVLTTTLMPISHICNFLKLNYHFSKAQCRVVQLIWLNSFTTVCISNEAPITVIFLYIYIFNFYTNISSSCFIMLLNIPKNSINIQKQYSQLNFYYQLSRIQGHVTLLLSAFLLSTPCDQVINNPPIMRRCVGTKR